MSPRATIQPNSGNAKLVQRCEVIKRRKGVVHYRCSNREAIYQRGSIVTAGNTKQDDKATALGIVGNRADINVNTWGLAIEGACNDFYRFAQEKIQDQSTPPESEVFKDAVGAFLEVLVPAGVGKIVLDGIAKELRTLMVKEVQDRIADAVGKPDGSLKLTAIANKIVNVAKQNTIRVTQGAKRILTGPNGHIPKIQRKLKHRARLTSEQQEFVATFYGVDMNEQQECLQEFYFIPTPTKTRQQERALFKALAYRFGKYYAWNSLDRLGKIQVNDGHRGLGREREQFVKEALRWRKPTR